MTVDRLLDPGPATVPDGGWVPFAWGAAPPPAPESSPDRLEPPPPIPPPPIPPSAPAGGEGRRRPARLLVPAVTVALSLAAGWCGGVLSRDGSSASDAPAAVTATPASTGTSSGSIDVAAIVAALEPSVVSIETTIRTQRGPFVAQGEGAGTGVVIDDQGHVLTNAHVVDGATSITVTVDGQARDAELVAADTDADIAVVRVADTSGLVAATLADASTTAVGDEVVAIGNALALEGGLSVTRGIVSALDRSIETTSGMLTGLIQTDAAISSGNSGGPLVNALGQVVGINTAVATSSSGVEASNIGFAISIDDAMAVADQLIAA